MILNPTTTTGMNDWIAKVVPLGGKRKPFVCGIAPPTITEEEAFRMVETIINRNKVGQCDVTLKRRWQTQWQRKPTDPRLLERYRCD